MATKLSVPGTSEQLRAAIVAARKLLADTVDAVHPRTPARELFAYVTEYRARLAELVAACPTPGGGDNA